MTKIKQCITHSFACDCREEKFRKIEKENEILLEAIKFLQESDMYPHAEEALEKIEQLNKGEK